MKTYRDIAEKLRTQLTKERENDWKEGRNVLPSGVKIQWDSIDLAEKMAALIARACYSHDRGEVVERASAILASEMEF